MASRGTGGRSLAVRVKTAKGRKPSSTRWLQRQLNDPYVARARREGYRSRSAFKLIEMNDRFHFLRSGQRAVDLGAAPGGWSQVAASLVKSPPEAPNLVALDYLPMEPLAGVSFVQADLLGENAVNAIMTALGGNRPNVVLSDLAAPTTGHRKTDHLRTTGLFEAAAAFAVDALAPGGHFLAKVFRGGTEAALLAELKRNFQTVIHVKPKASRQESVELYVLARGFRGR